MLHPSIHALLALALTTLALKAPAQVADCAAAAAKCTAACATRITGGLNAVRQCKAGCDTEQQACNQRAQAASAPATANAATPDPKAARAALAGQRLGSHNLSVGPLPTGEGLRPYEVIQLDGVPLLDLTDSQYDGSRVAPLQGFVRSYRQAKLDWTSAAQVNYEPKEGGDGSGLVRHWLRTNQLAADAKALEADLGYGLQGTAWKALEPEVLRAWIPCAGVLAAPNTPCGQDSARRGMAQYQGANEFERDRSRGAYLKEAGARLQKAFSPRSVSFYVLEQRELRDYDFQRELFQVRPRMSMGSALAMPVNKDAPLVNGVFGTPIAVDRLVADEVRMPKTEAEAWLRKVTEQQPPGVQGRRVFSLARLDCQTAPATVHVAANCKLASVQLFADPLLQVKVADL